MQDLKMRDIDGLIITEAESATLGDEGLIAYITGDGLNRWYRFVFDNTIDVDAPMVLTARFGATGGRWVAVDTNLPASGDDETPADATTSQASPTVTFGEVAGMTPAEAIMALHFPPTVTPQLAATMAITSHVAVNNQIAIERGESVGSVSWALTDNQSGGLDGVYNVDSDASGFSDINTPATTLDLSPTPDLGAVNDNVSITVSANYLEGPIPTDNYGNPAPAKRVAAGNASTTVTFVPFDYIYHGNRGALWLEWNAVDIPTRRSYAGQLTEAAVTNVLSNLTVQAGVDYVVMVPGTITSAIAISSGFDVSGIVTIEGPELLANKNPASGAFNYSLIRIAGQASESRIDTLTFS